MEGLTWHSEELGHFPLGDGLPFEQGNKMVTLAFYYLFIYLFIFGCVGSSFLCEGFL